MDDITKIIQSQIDQFKDTPFLKDYLTTIKALDELTREVQDITIGDDNLFDPEAIKQNKDNYKDMSKFASKIMTTTEDQKYRPA